MTGPRTLSVPDSFPLVACLVWRPARTGPLPDIEIARTPGLVLHHGPRTACLDGSAGAEGAGALLIALAHRLLSHPAATASGDRVPPAGLWILIAILPDTWLAADTEYWMAPVDISRTGSDTDPKAGTGGNTGARPETGLGRMIGRITARRAGRGASGLPDLLPVPGPEEIHATQDALLDAVSGLVRTTAPTGIAVTDLGDADGTEDAAADLCAALETRLHGDRTILTGSDGMSPDGPALPVLHLTGGVAAGAAGSAMPTFRHRRALSPARLGGIVTGLAGVVALSLVAPPLLAALFAPDAPPAPDMVRAAPAPGSFASACVGTLGGGWPRMAGWNVAARGCALPGHVPQSGPPPDARATGATAAPGATLVIWHRYVRAETANAVLAPRAAGQVLEDWAYGQQQVGDAIVLWHRKAIPLAVIAGQSEDRDQSPDTAQVQATLADLWARHPGAVVVENGGFVISAPSTPAEMLARAGQVAGFEPASVTTSPTRGAVLTLRPRQGRTVPAALLTSNRQEVTQHGF